MVKRLIHSWNLRSIALLTGAVIAISAGLLSAYLLGRIQAEQAMYTREFRIARTRLISTLGQELQMLQLNSDRSSDGQLFLFGGPIQESDYENLQTQLIDLFGREQALYILQRVQTSGSDQTGRE